MAIGSPNLPMRYSQNLNGAANHLSVPLVSHPLDRYTWETFEKSWFPTWSLTRFDVEASRADI